MKVRQREDEPIITSQRVGMTNEHNQRSGAFRLGIAGDCDLAAFFPARHRSTLGSNSLPMTITEELSSPGGLAQSESFLGSKPAGAARHAFTSLNPELFRPLHALFERCADAQPDSIALVDASGAITYGGLESRPTGSRVTCSPMEPDQDNAWSSSSNAPSILSSPCWPC